MPGRGWRIVISAFISNPATIAARDAALYAVRRLAADLRAVRRWRVAALLVAVVLRLSFGMENPSTMERAREALPEILANYLLPLQNPRPPP